MRSSIKIFFILTVALFFSLRAFSQDDRNIRVQGFLGLSSPVEKNMDIGLWSSFGFSLPLQERMALSFHFGYWKSHITQEAGKLYEGTLSINPFFMSVQYFPFQERTINPFLFIGGGFIFSSFRMGDIITIPEISLSQKVNNTPGFHTGAGIELKITQKLALCAEASFLYCKATATTIIQDLNFGRSTKDFSVMLSAFILNLGLKFLI